MASKNETPGGLISVHALTMEILPSDMEESVNIVDMHHIASSFYELMARGAFSDSMSFEEAVSSAVDYYAKHHRSDYDIHNVVEINPAMRERYIAIEQASPIYWRTEGAVPVAVDIDFEYQAYAGHYRDAIMKSPYMFADLVGASSLVWNHYDFCERSNIPFAQANVSVPVEDWTVGDMAVVAGGYAACAVRSKGQEAALHTKPKIDVSVPDAMDPFLALQSMVRWQPRPDCYADSPMDESFDGAHALAIHLCECAACVRAADVDHVFDDLCDRAEFQARACWNSSWSWDTMPIHRFHDVNSTAFDEIDRIADRLAAGTVCGEKTAWDFFVGPYAFSGDALDPEESLQKRADAIGRAAGCDSIESSLVSRGVERLAQSYVAPAHKRYEKQMTKVLDHIRSDELVGQTMDGVDMWTRWFTDIGHPAAKAYASYESALNDVLRCDRSPWREHADKDFWQSLETTRNDIAAKRGRWAKKVSSMNDLCSQGGKVSLSRNLQMPKSLEDIEAPSEDVGCSIVD